MTTRNFLKMKIGRKRRSRPKMNYKPKMTEKEARHSIKKHMKGEAT